MINIVETQMEGGRHLMINLSIINILKKTDSVAFYGDQEQIELISQTHKDIEFIPIRVQKDPPLWRIPFIIPSHLIILTKLLAQRKTLVILSIFPVTHYFFKIIWVHDGPKITIDRWVCFGGRCRVKNIHILPV